MQGCSKSLRQIALGSVYAIILAQVGYHGQAKISESVTTLRQGTYQNNFGE
jgi:hypothetical protein